MGSRLLARLDAQIAAEADPVRNACLRARRALYWARQGRRDEAEAAVRDIRQMFDARPNAAVTAWVSLAEALIAFFAHPGPHATDRLRRAHALSQAIAHAELQPLCAAWLAHLEFNASRWEPMLQHVAEALRLAQPEHHAALARVSLVVADAYHYAGRFDLAKDWYAAVREHALAEGDDAMISAMLHNMAALRANQVRIADCFGRALPDEGKWAFVEADSTQSYDTGIGTLSLRSFIPLVRAQLLVSERRFAEAVPLYSGSLDHALGENLRRREACFFADRAWCYVNLGQPELARTDVEAAIHSADAVTDVDDIAAAHARIANVLEHFGADEPAQVHRAVAQAHLDAYKLGQDRLLGLLTCAIPRQGDIPRTPVS